MALIETIPVKEDYRRKMAQALMREGMSSEPILHWAQGLARMGQAALGGYQMYQADQKDKETEAGNNAALIAALQGFGGGGSPAPSQPTPQNPTAAPPAPMTSVNPQAGAVPAALAAQPPKDPTNPNGGMYGGLGWRPIDSDPPPEPTKTAALSPMVPTPVKTEAIQPTAAPVVPTPTDTQMADAKARIAQMLQSDNPQMRKLGQGMAQTILTQQLQGEKPTDAIREFQFGQKNPAFNQSKIDLEAAKAAAVERAKRDGSVEYEASKAAAIEKAKALATKEVAKPEQDKQNRQVASIVTQDIDRAIGTIDKSILPTTGGTGNMLAMVGGTAAHNLSKLLDTVKSNAGFQELAKMRAASPTGAALGSVTERELALLQSTIGNLEQSQSSDQLKDNLRRVKNTYLDIIHGEGRGPDREKLTFQDKGGPIKIDGYTIRAR